MFCKANTSAPQFSTLVVRGADGMVFIVAVTCLRALLQVVVAL